MPTQRHQFGTGCHIPHFSCSIRTGGDNAFSVWANGDIVDEALMSSFEHHHLLPRAHVPHSERSEPTA